MQFNKKYVDSLSSPERAAYTFEHKIKTYIEKLGGQFLKDENGSFHILIKGKRIPLVANKDNYALAQLMMRSCGVTMMSAGAQAAIQRLQVCAYEKAGGLRLRRFSALSRDRRRLYVPTAGNDLLLVTAEEISTAKNGDNQDSLWLEHPYGDALDFTSGDPVTDLGRFEDLLVNTQACAVSEMKWFVAMAEGLFPYIRDLCGARLLTVHLGPSQCGKTTGARRFVILHGLGDVKGDFSVAALGNHPDLGLLALDNKEQQNFSQPLIDYCLFLATGAERGRSTSEGALRTSGNSRPVGVITSIEGIPKHELQKRCAVIQYVKQPKPLKLAPIENGIREHRHQIGSALIAVLHRYLQIAETSRDLPNPIPEFEEHFTALCQLLLAYADLASKPTAWADRIINMWGRTLSEAESDENELEHPLLRLFRDESITATLQKKQITHQGSTGTLYITDMTDLLTDLQKLNLRDLSLPKTAAGLGRRISTSTFQNLAVLREETNKDIDCLKRKSALRPVGIFVPSEVPSVPV